jgi:hypothetical protein
MALALLQNSVAEAQGGFLPDRSGPRAILPICRFMLILIGPSCPELR